MSKSNSGTSATSRRDFLKKSTIAAGAMALPAAARRARAAPSLRQVPMTLDWLYEGPNSGFLLAQEQGFYREAGLDIAFSAGKGSGSTAQLVASKAAPIGFSDGFAVGKGVARGMAIKTVASIFRRNPSAIMVFDNSPIKTPQDLVGKTMAISPGSAVFQQWPAFAKGAGLDPSKVQVVNIDPAGVGPSLITGKVDAIGAYVQSFAPSIEIRSNKKLRIFWFADYEVTVVSNGIIVHNDLLTSDPDLIRAFVPASIKGFLYGRQHPDEAAAAVRKYQGTADLTIARREFEISWKTWVTPNTRGKPLGWGSEADWTSAIEVLKTYGGVTTPLTTSQLFTNDFVPSGAEYVPPQEGLGSPTSVSNIADKIAAQSEAYLRVENLSKVYATRDGEVRALNDVSFTQPRGEFLSHVGPSGCGKSTLLMIAAGLVAGVERYSPGRRPRRHQAAHRHRYCVPKSGFAGMANRARQCHAAGGSPQNAPQGRRSARPSIAGFGRTERLRGQVSA